MTTPLVDGIKDPVTAPDVKPATVKPVNGGYGPGQLSPCSARFCFLSDQMPDAEDIEGNWAINNIYLKKPASHWR
jgi:hypothetical protein